MNSERTVLVIACGVTVMMGMNTSLLGPSLATLAARSGSTLADVGALFAALSVGFLVSTPMIVWVSRRFGLRPLLAAPAAIMISMAVFAAAPSLPALLGAAALLGMAQACTQLSYSTWIGLRSPDGNAAAATLNRVLAFYGVGSLLGPFLVSICLRIWNDPLPAFAMLIVPNLAAALFGLRLPEARPAQSAQTESKTAAPRGNVLDLLRKPAVLILAFLLAVYVGAEVAFSSWVTEVVVRVVGVDAAQAALAASGFFAGFAVGRYFAGVLIARTGVRRGMLALLATAALGVGLTAIPGATLATAVVAATIVGVGYGPLYPMVSSIAIRRFPADAAAVNSVVGGIASLGMFFFPPLTGRLLVGEGVFAAWGLQAALIVVMAAVTVFARSVVEGRE
jgi:fucose permease